MQSDFQQRAEELYQAGVADGFRAGFVNTLKKALEEAALSAAEPVGEVAGQQGRYWMTDEGRWSNWFDITFNTWVPEPGVREVRNLYAAPPAPPVAEEIADAVLSWMVEYDLLDAGNEYRAADVVAVLDDFKPSYHAALSAQVQDVAAKSLADAYQKYLDASDLYNERLAISKTKALGTMRVDEEYRAIDEARRAFDKLAVEIAKSALPAAPAKQEG